MKRVLIVGGAGFIGARVMLALQEDDIRIRVLDLERSLVRFAVNPEIEAVAGDVTDGATVESAARDCDTIIHLAGLMTVDCAADPERAVRINVLGSVHVFEAARRVGASVAYLSSAAVFGPESAAAPQPMSIYGVTKLAVEGLARVYHQDHGVPSLGLRPYIVYGPGVSSGIAAGPSIALAAAVAGREATIRFSGRVGFVHVDDVAHLLAAAATSSMTGAAVLKMAGDTREMSDFVAELERQSGWKGAQIDGPPLKIPADLASDATPDYLGSAPVTSIEKGIADTLAELRRKAQ